MHATNKRQIIAAGELRRLYCDDLWTIASLAEHFKLGQSTVRRRLTLPTRSAL
jgi:hypothetical protein